MKRKDAIKLWEEDGDLDLMQTYFQAHDFDDQTKERIKKLTLDKLARNADNLVEDQAIPSSERSRERISGRFRGRLKSLWWQWQWKLALPVAGLALIIFLGQWAASGTGLGMRLTSMPQVAAEYDLAGSPEGMPEMPAEDSLGAGSKNAAFLAEEPASAYQGQGEVVPVVPPADQGVVRKVTHNVNVRLEVDDVTTVINEMNHEAVRLGGYVVESHHSGERETAAGSIVLKIPAESLNSFQGELSGWGRILSQDQWANDITNQYYDAQTRLRHWEAEEKRYVEILAQAQSVDEILQVEGSLANIREQIEQLKGQLKYWDNEVAYSTVQVYLEQPSQPLAVANAWQPVAWQKTWQAMKDAALKTVSSTWNALNYLAVGLGYLFPYLVLGGISWGGYRLWRKRKLKIRNRNDN